MEKNKGFFRRFFAGTWYGIGLIVAAVLCFLGILMLTGHFEGLNQPEAVGAAPLNPGQTQDVSALSETFGLPLPTLPGYSMRGQALNVSYNGRNVRQAILQYDGFTITCVQPAFAAPLLLRSDLSLSLEEGISVDGLPAALSEKGSSFCLYFNTDNAAYSIFAPTAEKENFLQLAEKIVFTE